MRTRDQILAEALKLPPVERAELMESLLSSFDFSAREDIDSAWAVEAEDRIDALERDKLQVVPVEEVLAETDRAQQAHTDNIIAHCQAPMEAGRITT